jgi:large subunit ribosomal protein L28
VVKYAARKRQAQGLSGKKGSHKKMAKCAHCGKATTFGHNVSFSHRITNRPYHPNLQKVTVVVNGRKVKKTLCTKCIRTLVKTI